LTKSKVCSRRSPTTTKWLAPSCARYATTLPSLLSTGVPTASNSSPRRPSTAMHALPLCVSVSWHAMTCASSVIASGQPTTKPSTAIG
jgi:hypothetical protein